MPNGYGPAMRAFTKVLKPPFAVLRENGQLSVVFADDIYLQGDNSDECQQNVWITKAFSVSLRSTIHVKKSILNSYSTNDICSLLGRHYSNGPTNNRRESRENCHTMNCIVK